MQMPMPIALTSEVQVLKVDALSVVETADKEDITNMMQPETVLSAEEVVGRKGEELRLSRLTSVSLTPAWMPSG